MTKPPFPSNGPPDGPHPPPEPAQPDAVSAPSTTPVNEPPLDPATKAWLTGEPDAATDLRWCKVCQAMVRPIGKGRCERCNAFLKLNFSARKHPVNRERRQQLLDRLVGEYQPSTTMMRSTCEHLAGTLEQLEVIKPGSPEWQRLIAVSQTLRATLDEARAAAPRRSENYRELSDDQLVDHLEELLRQAYSRREARRLSAEVATRSLTPVDPSIPGHEAPETSRAPASTVEPAPTAEPACSFCYRDKTACAAMRDERLDIWRALHARHPEEVKRRQEAATAVMRHQLGKPLPEWYSQ